MRVGFVGAGGISRAHALALRRVEGAELVAWYDRDAAAATGRAAEFGGRVCGSEAELVDRVDAVYVLTPPRAHRATVVAAAEAGRAVFCEKPIAATVDDARVMVEVTGRCGVTFAVGFNHRLRPAVRRVREVVGSGGVGEVLSCWSRRLGYNRTEPERNWRTSRDQLVGMTIESVSHDIDMLRFVVGEIAMVSGVVRSSLPELAGYDDNLSATLVLESGAIGSICASWSSHLGHGSRGVVGTEGSVAVEGPDQWSMSRVRLCTDAGGVEQVERFPRRVADDWGYVGVNASFVEAVAGGGAGGGEPAATGVDGLRALEVSTALLESARTQRSVPIPRDEQREVR